MAEHRQKETVVLFYVYDIRNSWQTDDGLECLRRVFSFKLKDERARLYAILCSFDCSVVIVDFIVKDI